MTIDRRKFLAGAAAGSAALATGALASATTTSATLAEGSSARMPVVFLPHGGGPWPFVDLGPLIDRREFDALYGYLAGLPAQLPQRPKALLVISAHWEERVPTVMTSAAPPILYDYYNFPPESYQIQWPAPGEPALAARVRDLLGTAGIETAADPGRGYDHGTFIPLKVAWPDADVPTVQLSLRADYDPAAHLAIGRALAPLRDEGVLILGSGMSFHNLREMVNPRSPAHGDAFDRWLQGAVVAPPESRDAALVCWVEAPSARYAHPQEDHLLPLMVIAGAAGADRGVVAFNDTFARARITAVHFGA